MKHELSIFATVNLREFEGFHGLGYFRLGKSMLTGIMANFTTYLIVLLQFKVSEL